MVEKEKDVEKHMTVQLGGMGLYGTTSNVNIAGYQATGDLENAGHPEKGFKKESGYSGAIASLEGTEQRD